MRKLLPAIILCMQTVSGVCFANLTTSQEIQQLYIGYLGRAADAAGLAYWTGEVDQGRITVDQIRINIVNEQPEYLENYGQLTNTEFAIKVYQNLLNREPDQAGLEYWVGELDSGSVLPEVLILAYINGVSSEEDENILSNKLTVAECYTNNPDIYSADLVETIIAELDSTSAYAQCPPVANAGADQTGLLTGELVQLSGSGLDVEGQLSFLWEQTAGPEVTLSSTELSNPSFTAVSAGTYAFSLTVTDSAGASSTDSAEVFVSQAQMERALEANLSFDRTLVKAGERVLILVNVGNSKLLPISNVSVQTTLPEGLSFNWANQSEPNVTSGCSNCSGGSTAAWSLGTLDAGESRTITLDALVAGELLSGERLDLSFSVTADDENTLNLNRSIDVQNDLAASMALGLSNDPLVPGESMTYRVDLGNLSDGFITNARIELNLPEGLTVDSVSDDGAVPDTGQIAWDIASMAVGETLFREVSVTVSDALLAGRILTANAQLMHDGGLVVDHQVEHAVTLVDDAPSLKLDINTSKRIAQAGERVLYTITVSNPSLLPINDTYVHMHVSEGLSFNWSTHVEPNIHAGCSNCSEGSYAGWTLETLEAGESRNITIDAAIDADLLSGNLIVLPVSVTGNTLKDTIKLNHSLAIQNDPESIMALSISDDPLIPGESVGYRVDVGNISAGFISNARIELNLPDGYSVDYISNNGLQPTANQIVWDVPSISVGEALFREVEVTASETLQPGEILNAEARLMYDEGLEVDNLVEHSLTVIEDAPTLNMRIHSAARHAVAGERMLYTFTVSNTSLLPVDDVLVHLHVPRGLSFNWSTNVEPNINIGCSNCSESSYAGWTLNTLAAGESRVITIDAAIDSDLLSGDLIHLPLSLTGSTLEDTVQLSYTLAIQNDPDESMALSVSEDPLVAGDSFIYRLDIGNVSAGFISNAQIELNLPDGLTVQSISDGGVQPLDQLVTWELPSMTVGESLFREIAVTSSQALQTGQILVADARLLHDGDWEVDQQVEQSVTIRESAAPLDLDISSASRSVTAGETASYTITTTNTSLLPVDDVIVHIHVPRGISFNWANDAEPNVTSGCSNCSEGAYASWSLGTLASGASQEITIDADVAADLLSGNLSVLPVTVSGSTLEDSIFLTYTLAIE